MVSIFKIFPDYVSIHFKLTHYIFINFPIVFTPMILPNQDVLKLTKAMKVDYFLKLIRISNL